MSVSFRNVVSNLFVLSHLLWFCHFIYDVALPLHIKCVTVDTSVRLLVTSKIMFTLYWVWWFISLILLYQTTQLREICRKSCSSWSLRSLSWRSSLRWEEQWGLCWQRSWPISKHSRSCAWVNNSTTQFVLEKYRL